MRHMWNQAKTGIIVLHEDGHSVFLESGQQFDEMRATAEDWTPPPIVLPPLPTLTEHIAATKAESSRRIVAILPEWKQRNLTAQAAILAEKGRANWTADELAAWEAGAALWAKVAAIRAASDVIEAMEPIPRHVSADDLWPEAKA